jgi:pimeloyl-ACP methyl ester carboxylesterase
VSERTVRTSARGIVYSDRGGGPPVVLLHGWCLSRRLWLYQEAALIEKHRVICPDLPGFGDSADVGGPYNLERYGAEVAAFLDEIGERDVLVCGFAFGAVVAMAAVADHGARPGRLVLISVPSAATAAYDRMPRAMRRDWPEFARRSARAICKQPQSDATLDWLAGIFGATPLPVALETVALLGAFEPVLLAPRVDVATVLVHGSDDDVVPVSVSRSCAKVMPRARVEIVPESGHLVVLDQKDLLNELLLNLADGFTRE